MQNTALHTLRWTAEHPVQHTGYTDQMTCAELCGSLLPTVLNGLSHFLRRQVEGEHAIQVQLRNCCVLVVVMCNVVQLAQLPN